MLTSLFITSLFVAGIAVCWRNLQTDSPKLAAVLARLPYLLRKPLTCGFCFTYWTALVTVLVYNPAQSMAESWQVNLPAAWYPAIDIFIGWVVVGMSAVIIRFGYVVLQELVHYQVHHLRHSDTEHKH